MSIETEPSFRAGAPEVLFEGPYELDRAGPGNRNYDVTADGQRFLMIQSSADPSGSGIHVVLNWTSEIARAGGDDPN